MDPKIDVEEHNPVKKSVDITEIYELLISTDLSKYRCRELLVPVEWEFIKWHESSEKKLFMKDKAAGVELLSDDTALTCWKKTRGSSSITAATMIPIGICVLLYNSTFHNHDTLWGGEGQLPFTPVKVLAQHPLVRQASNDFSSLRQPSIDPGYLVPFVTLLGSDNIREYCKRTR